MQDASMKFHQARYSWYTCAYARHQYIDKARNVFRYLFNWCVCNKYYEAGNEISHLFFRYYGYFFRYYGYFFRYYGY